MGLEELEERNVNLDSIEQNLNQVEKDLGEASTDFASAFDSKVYTWQDVQKQLGPDEAAVEIIRYRDFLPDSGGTFTGTIHYAALIVKNDGSKLPQLVLIENGNDLENRFLANYRNAIRYKVPDRFTYSLFWEPIANQLDGIKKVYLSPDGVYNQVNPVTFRNPQTGEFLLDEIQIQLVSNTKELVILASKKNRGKRGSSELFGFPNYNLGIDDDIDLNQGTEGEERGLRGDGLSRGALRGSLSRGLRGSLLRLMRDGQHIAMLPGTKKEIENISELHQKQGSPFNTLLFDQASEEKLKMIRSPETLHIATHGFFVADPEPITEETEADIYIENPLLRSGLVLAGANKLITQLPLKGEEDGILTAYEAMNLHLNNTSLVVLSACETGLGEVKNGEGVYGLQRAFLVAGAQSIIMSLWSVDDNATQELMSVFYKEWLKTSDKQVAFRSAQTKLKEKYPEPFFWGAFVMMGL